MGNPKKHKKHKDKKHSISSPGDESNHSFASIASNSLISNEQKPLKLVLKVGSTNSPHMSPSIHTQDLDQEGNLSRYMVPSYESTFSRNEMMMGVSSTDLELNSNMQIDNRPYSSSLSKKMKKKKSKKKHKKHSHHSHHHHSHHHHHKHRSSCSHHSSKSSFQISNQVPVQQPNQFFINNSNNNNNQILELENNVNVPENNEISTITSPSVESVQRNDVKNLNNINNINNVESHSNININIINNVNNISNVNSVNTANLINTNLNINVNNGNLNNMMLNVPQINLESNTIQQPQISISTHNQSIVKSPPQVQLARAPIGLKPLVKSQFQSLLNYLLKQLEKRDPQEFFSWPVTDLIAPGYSSIITKPMDFSTIKQKINLNMYENLIQFRADVKLMCDNAMTYNRTDTIYYKAARRLWHYAKEKLFNRDAVLELVKLYQGVTNYELGLTCADYTDSEQMNVSVTNMNEYLQYNEQFNNNDQNHFYNENALHPTVKASKEMTPDQILMEAKKAAQGVADRLSLEKPNGSYYTLLRQLDDGTTTLAILGNNNNGYYDEKYVNLESIVGKLNEGQPHMPVFKESDLNIVKPMENLCTSPFSSYLPTVDSSKSNLNEEESSLLLSAYGEDEIGLAYSQSLIQFASDSDHVLNMVDSLLDVLTSGQHTKVMNELKEKRNEQKTKVEDKNNREKSDLNKKDEDTKKNSFDELNKKENNENFLDKKLNETTNLLTQLESVQNQRLSMSTLPIKPNKEEVKIAHLLSNKLTELISTCTAPADITDIKSIRKALGVQIKSESTF